ncbi:2OG-Fe(II) oxygenase [uncultured Enterovirga sp.]|uniref:2OG-Fe(II) oxygenase n=1 Tax=uncultured Enterovirga sp. TaxID=2026352 RepID=UPI0035C95184
MALSLLNVDAIRTADRSSEPYDYMLGSGFLKADAVADLRRDFPAIEKPGYLTVDEVQLKGRFRDLITELESEELTEELSKRFGRDLHPFPRLTTIMKRSQPKYGTIHTDGPSKVMTMLVYMNDNWEAGEGGRLRVLYDGEHFEPYKVEVPPVMGTVFAFLRGDQSWHGHQPFVGERKVVQIAWVTNADELARKKKRNRAAQFFKGIFGR